MKDDKGQIVDGITLNEDFNIEMYNTTVIYMVPTNNWGNSLEFSMEIFQV